MLNIVNGFGVEAGKPLASSDRVAKVAFTGETTTGRLIMQYASENLNPVTLELGGKSPNVFFEDVMAHDDAFLDKADEGFVLFALNQGEKILSYFDIGQQEGAEVLVGGARATVEGLEGGYYVQPTIFKGSNDMRVFEDEIFDPVVSVKTFRDFDHAMEIANDTLYGLGAGVWTSNA